MFTAMQADKLYYRWSGLFLLLLISFQLSCTGQEAYVKLQLVEMPATTPTGEPIFAAGTFNNWNPADSSYKLQKNEQGYYELLLPLRLESAEFKFTRGSWQTVETDTAGNDVPNRTLVLDKGAEPVLKVAGWKDQLQPAAEAPSTAAANVQIISQAFDLPQLGRRRRIWLYLPPDYATSGKQYPVLYMHDGQNLFDKATSGFAAEWGIDETLNTLVAQGKSEGVLVVGIDHGGNKRIAEYTPWTNKEYGGGEGADYVQFIVETLKPYIDTHYRTLPAQQHTGLAGSSLGGLISLYGALNYPQVFGKIGVFSPAFWFNPELYEYARKHIQPEAQQQFYFFASARESKEMVPDMKRMQQLLLKKGVTADNLFYKATEDGAHSEWYWEREFPAAFQWLFER